MRKLIWFVAGAIAMFLGLDAGGFLFLRTRADGFSSNMRPSFLERWAAREARSMAMPGAAKALPNPAPNSPEVLADARSHWADHCASCHANDGSGDTMMGKHLYPPAPDMRKSDTQNLSDGELFYIIQNGIRLTGMPAWGGSAHDAEDSWKLVRFIRHLPALALDERRQMEKLNPRSPDELKEEEEEEKFLKGENSDEPKEHHHH